MIRIALGLLLLVVLEPRRAEACSPVTYDQHFLDPAHAADQVAPSAPIADGYVYRDTANGGCNSCGDLSSIVISASATDDRTPAEQVGFQLKVVRGIAPFAALGPIRPQYSDEMRIFFDPEVRGYSFDVEVRAVDLNGNIGAPTVITIEDVPEEGGCAVQPGVGSALSIVLAFLALGLAQRRRG